MREHLFLKLGAFLMGLLGLARGIGGILLLVRGAAADSAILAAGSAVTVIGAVLVLIALALIVAALGLVRRSRGAWHLGLAATLVFVIDGAVNGYLLYGRFGGSGTFANVLAAAIIMGCLLLGQRALNPATPGTPARDR